MKRVKISDWSLAVPGRDAVRVAVDGILLLLTLWGTVFTAVSAYGIEADALWLGSVCLLLCALYLFLFSWPRAMLPGAILIAVLWGTALWLKRDVMLNGALQIAGYVLGTLAEVFEVGMPVIPDMSAAARRELVTWTLSMAVIPLGGFLGWSVIRARSPALTLLLSLLLFLPALLAGALPDWLSLMALTFCYCLLLLASLSARHDPRGSARFTLLCMPFAALLLGALTLLIPKTYTAPQWAGTFRARTEEIAASLMDNNSLGSLLPGGAVETTVRLDRAGPRQFTGQTVFTVSGDTPGRVYLRGVSSASYTGSAWEPLEDDDYAEIGLDGDNNLIHGVSPFNLPSLTASEPDYSELRIDYSNSLSGCMYAPYQLATAPDEIEGVTFQNDSWLSRRFGIQQKNLFYRPDAAPESAMLLPRTAAGAEEVYRKFVYDNYTSLPSDFQQTVDRWEQRLNQILEENPEAQARAMESWGNVIRLYPPGRYDHPLLLADWYALLLELTSKYDLDTPYTPDGADFVDYFLNESHRGYCVHFASAGVLLMRASGVPARYVEGYTTVVPKFGTASVLDSDAHAWVEIYLDGYGWYPVDMTPPGGTGIEAHSTLGEKLPDEPETDPPEDSKKDTEEPPKPDLDKPEPTPPSTPNTPQPEVIQTKPRSVLWLWIPLLLLALAVLSAQSALRRELLDRRLNAPGCNRAVIAAYGYMERLVRWGGNIEPEAISLAQRAKFSQHALTEAERAQMLSLADSQRERAWEGMSKWRRLLFWLSGL